MLTKQKI